MEELMHEEILQLFNKLDNQINLPLSMSLIYNVSVVNALWTLLNGTRLSLDDPALHNLLQKIDLFSSICILRSGSSVETGSEFKSTTSF